MKAKALKELTEEELMEKTKELSRELFNLRFQKATGQLGKYCRNSQNKKRLGTGKDGDQGIGNLQSRKINFSHMNLLF